jgi:hypothetical protein
MVRLIAVNTSPQLSTPAGPLCVTKTPSGASFRCTTPR